MSFSRKKPSFVRSRGYEILGAGNGSPIVRTNDGSTDTTFYNHVTIPIDAYQLEVGDRLEFWAWYTYTAFTLASISKTMAPRIGSTNLPTTAISSGSTTSCTMSSVMSIRDNTTFRGSNTAQSNSGNQNATAIATVTQDIRTAFNIYFGGFWGSNPVAGTENITLEDYELILYRRGGFY